MIPQVIQHWLRKWVTFAKRNYLGLMFKLVVIAILAGAAGMFVFECHGGIESQGPAWYQKLWSALWWSVVTMTTVGYGDISPVSFGGRIVAILLMTFGIGFLGMFTVAYVSGNIN